MKKLLHLSDIHFGRTDASVIDALTVANRMLDPDLVIISGDLTQRARRAQFEEAQALIRALHEGTRTVIAVPGNHDLAPFFRPLSRLFRPRSAYDRHITPHVLNRYADDDVAICGISTERALRIKEGRISNKDTAEVIEWFGKQGPARTRIVVSHHPLDLPHASARSLAQGAERAVRAFEQVPVDLFLSGHLHRGSITRTVDRYVDARHGAIAIQAGTASTRGRGEHPSFNLLRLDESRLDVDVHTWDPSTGAFIQANSHAFIKEERGWTAAP